MLPTPCRRTDASTLKAISGCESGDWSGGCSSAAPRTTPFSKKAMMMVPSLAHFSA